jgi:hypothetical protein
VHGTSNAWAAFMFVCERVPRAPVFYSFMHVFIAKTEDGSFNLSDARALIKYECGVCVISQGKKGLPPVIYINFILATGAPSATFNFLLALLSVSVP